MSSYRQESEQATYRRLTTCVIKRLSGPFDGSVLWHLGAVILNLEIREVIRKEKNDAKQMVYSLGEREE